MKEIYINISLVFITLLSNSALNRSVSMCSNVQHFFLCHTHSNNCWIVGSNRHLCLHLRVGTRFLELLKSNNYVKKKHFLFIFMFCNFLFGKCRRQIVAFWFFFTFKIKGSRDWNQNTVASVRCQPTANCYRPQICGFCFLIPAVCSNVQEDCGVVFTSCFLHCTLS
jgi:hypothetical protein